MKIIWSETSTKRGVVWLVGGAIGVIFAFLGKDPSTVMSITASVAGGLGLLISDNQG